MSEGKTVTLRGGPLDGRQLKVQNPATAALHVPVAVRADDPDCCEFDVGVYSAANGFRFELQERR